MSSTVEVGMPPPLHARTAASLLAMIALTLPLLAQEAVPPRSEEQIEASYARHKGDFDYLLGDWKFKAVREEGSFQGYWSAVRLPNRAGILDEYRIVGDSGQTYASSVTIRVYNGVLDRWELISAEGTEGLHDRGTARRVGEEMHIEQRFGVMGQRPSIWRIRYYDIRPDRFSWTADCSSDGGKMWTRGCLKIEAVRIGPPRPLRGLVSMKTSARVP